MKGRDLLTNFAGRRAADDQVVCATNADRYTNALLQTHEGKEVRFYDDLIKGKQAIFNLMYATCEGACPLVTSNLIKVHRALKNRMGKDLFMYSITLKPEQDKPNALKDFAEMHGALLPGWAFLTGDPFDIETIRFRLFRWDHIKFDLDLDFHTSMLRIVNDTTNCWTMVTPYASLYTVLEHISWADPPKSLKERLIENKAIQERIDQEVKLYGYRKTT